MIEQIHQDLGHLLQVERFGPVGVPYALSRLEFCLNIRQWADPRDCRHSGNKLFAGFGEKP